MNFEKLSTCEAIADKFSKPTACICSQYYELKIFFKFVHSRAFFVLAANAVFFIGLHSEKRFEWFHDFYVSLN